MRPRRLHLKAHIDPAEPIRILDGLIMDGQNALSRVPGAGLGAAALRLAAEYVQWVERVDPQLRALTTDYDLTAALYTERYWRIRQLHEEPLSPYQLVRSEFDEQTAWLGELRDDLQNRAKRAAAAPGDPVVLDTNVLLEFQSPESVDWLGLAESGQVRLVVPLRVVEELDVWKYDRRRQDRAERARAAIRFLDRFVGPAGQAGQIRSRTTIEILLEPSPRARPVDADEEILRVCCELQQYVGAVKLVTADMGMRLRAHALALSVITMPECYPAKPPGCNGVGQLVAAGRRRN